MQRNRPTSVLVIAIFHFIFGGFGLVCGLFGLVGQAAGLGNQFNSNPPAGAGTQQQELHDFQERVKQRSEQEAPLQKTLAPINAAINLLLSVLLLVSGLGLVQMKGYGWWGSVAYGVASLLMMLYLILFNLCYSLPIAQRILDEELKSHPTLGTGPVAAVMQAVVPLSIAFMVLGLIYPSIVLIVMSRSKVRAAFRGESTSPEDFGGRNDPHDRADDYRPAPPGYGQEPPGYSQEPDDRYGAGPR